MAFKMLFYKKAENCSRSTIFFLVLFEQLQWLSSGFCAFTEKSTTRLLENRFRSSRSQMVPQNMFSKNLQFSQENISVGVSFLGLQLY